MTPGKIIRLLIILVVMIVATLSLKFVGYHSKEDKGFIGFVGRLLNKTNSFNITYSDINKEDIDVIFNSEYGLVDTLVKNGEIKNNINYEYGKERFTVFYKDTVLVSDGFFSTNNNDPHAVEINISKRPDGFLVLYTIDEKKDTIHLDKHRRKTK